MHENICSFVTDSLLSAAGEEVNDTTTVGLYVVALVPTEITAYGKYIIYIVDADKSRD